MSFNISCPHCAKTLRVTERAFGKTVPCPGCGQPIQVEAPPPISTESGVDPPRRTRPAYRVGQESRPTEMPAAMPPMPSSDGTQKPGWRDAAGITATGGLAGVVERLNLTDMLLGNEKEHVFHLLPGEKALDELLIHHQHLLFIKSGVTRVTLTTQRLLYTATRVFSPVYWLLLVLLPPLILYYAVRLARNRNAALPLTSIDSVEKRYRPHGMWFILAVVVAALVSRLCGVVADMAFDSTSLTMVVSWLVLGLLAPAVLVLLLWTRMVGFDVRSRGGNLLFIRYSPLDAAGSEEQFDMFFQRVLAQIQRTQASKTSSDAEAASVTDGVAFQRLHSAE